MPHCPKNILHISRKIELSSGCLLSYMCKYSMADKSIGFHAELFLGQCTLYSPVHTYMHLWDGGMGVRDITWEVVRKG